MAANVRCAGFGAWIKVRTSPHQKRWHVQRVPNSAPAGIGAYTEPCGWKGERFPTVSAAIPIEDEQAAIERAMVRRACPRCGGRVELIPREPA